MKNAKAYFYLVLTTVIWGSMYIFSKFVFTAMHPFIFLFFRFLIGSAILLTYYFLRGGKISKMKIEKKDWKYIFCVGFVGYFLGIGFQLLGTDYCDASLASLINSINPVVIIVLAFFILKEKVTKKQMFSVAIALAGTVIIVGQIGDSQSTWGAVISICSVLCWSFGSVMVRFITGKYDTLIVTIWSMVLGAACALLLGIYQINITPVDTSSMGGMFIFSFLFICVISTGISFLTWNKALSMVSAATCSLFYPIQPLVSAIMGILILGETLTINFLVGGSLIVFGILYSVLGKSKSR